MIDDNKYIIRKATLDDVEFIATVIIEAEKSMTNNFGLANFFELSEEDIRKYIIQILEEEVDGCEFSLSSFFVAMGTYQLEYSYTRDDHRGHRLIQRLMMAHLAYAKELNPNVKKAQLHVFENNPTIIKVHERSGYHIAKRYVSDNPLALEYYPYNVELLMEKNL